MSNRQLEQIVDGIAVAYNAERQRNRSVMDLALESLEQLREEVRSGKTNLQREAEEMLAEIRQRKMELRDGEPGPQGDKGDPGEAAPDLSEAAIKAVLEKLREDRLEIDERLFAATKRFDRLSTEFEERLANLKDGEPGPAGMPGPAGPAGRDGATGEPRGKYDPAETYQKLDRVSFNGSEWIARKNAPGPLPGDGWMLGAMGKKGRPGVGIQNAVVRDYALVLEMTDGKAMTIDLRGMFERYDQERDA
jgi:integrin beta 3